MQNLLLVRVASPTVHIAIESYRLTWMLNTGYFDLQVTIKNDASMRVGDGERKWARRPDPVYRGAVNDVPSLYVGPGRFVELLAAGAEKGAVFCGVDVRPFCICSYGSMMAVFLLFFSIVAMDERSWSSAPPGRHLPRADSAQDSAFGG